MRHDLTTQPSLLVRIRDPLDAGAWAQFVEIYAPLVYGYLRKRSLQDADAADVAQEVMRTVSQTIGQWTYDPGRGTFRGWLLSVVNSRLTDFRRKQQRQLATMANAAAAHDAAFSNTAAASAEWDRDYQRQLFHAAAQQVREDFSNSSWQAFWQTAVEGKSASQAAQRLGVSTAAVYLAKARVMARIRQQLEILTGEPI